MRWCLRGCAQIITHQIFDKKAKELWAAGDACLAIDGIGLRLDGAFGGDTQHGDFGGGHAFDGKQGNVTFSRGQAPLGKAFLQQVHEGPGCAAQAFAGGVAFTQGAAQGEGTKDEAEDQAEGGTHFNHLARLPGNGRGAQAKDGGEDVGYEKDGANGLHKEDRKDPPALFHTSSPLRDGVSVIIPAVVIIIAAAATVVVIIIVVVIITTATVIISVIVGPIIIVVFVARSAVIIIV
jgi:hypothetical protein